MHVHSNAQAETLEDKSKIFEAKMERNFVLIVMWKQPECALGYYFYMHSTKEGPEGIYCAIYSSFYPDVCKVTVYC
jgi:hypothetical protein